MAVGAKILVLAPMVRLRLFDSCGLEMLWVDAPRVSACVVEISVRLAVSPHVSHTVSAIGVVANLEAPVLLASKEACPAMTATRSPFPLLIETVPITWRLGRD